MYVYRWCLGTDTCIQLHYYQPPFQNVLNIFQIIILLLISYFKDKSSISAKKPAKFYLTLRVNIFFRSFGRMEGGGGTKSQKVRWSTHQLELFDTFKSQENKNYCLTIHKLNYNFRRFWGEVKLWRCYKLVSYH